MHQSGFKPNAFAPMNAGPIQIQLCNLQHFCTYSGKCRVCLAPMLCNTCVVQHMHSNLHVLHSSLFACGLTGPCVPICMCCKASLFPLSGIPLSLNQQGLRPHSRARSSSSCMSNGGGLSKTHCIIFTVLDHRSWAGRPRCKHIRCCGADHRHAQAFRGF